MAEKKQTAQFDFVGEALSTRNDKPMVLKTVPSGEIRVELGADGVYLQFDCDCLDALPYCKAQCCGMIGTEVTDAEREQGDYVCYEADDGAWVLRRGADGFCHYLNRDCRTCTIYENRPQTCQDYHCTRGADMRGWKLANRAHRLPQGGED